MQVTELDGATLDYWVAKAEGFEFAKVEDDMCWVTWVDCPEHPSDTGAVDEAYSASTDWMIAGPIIEREYINVVHGNDATVDHPGTWTAYAGVGHECGAHGASLLTAAMRAFVTLKIGATVPEVPNETTTF